MNLVYLPIDIPCQVPHEEKILDWFHSHCLLDTDYWEYTSGRHKWCMVSTSKEPKNWRRYDKEMWDNRRVEQDTKPEVLLHPGFETEFPQLANVLKQLPFKQLTVSGMLYQLGDIPLHSDTHDPHEPTEPRRYTIYLTNPEYNTFYFERDGVKHFPKINKDYCCFVFNNRDIQHGALMGNREKMILTIAGILDNEKHDILLERSLNKFKDEALYL